MHISPWPYWAKKDCPEAGVFVVESVAQLQPEGARLFVCRNLGTGCREAFRADDPGSAPFVEAAVEDAMHAMP